MRPSSDDLLFLTLPFHGRCLTLGACDGEAGKSGSAHVPEPERLRDRAANLKGKADALLREADALLAEAEALEAAETGEQLKAELLGDTPV